LDSYKLFLAGMGVDKMADYQSIQIPIATSGLNKDLQPTQIPSASPNMKNMYVENWGVKKRLGYSKFGGI